MQNFHDLHNIYISLNFPGNSILPSNSTSPDASMAQYLYTIMGVKMIQVTGAGEKTGRAVIRALKTQGARICAIVNTEKNKEGIEGLGAEAILGDMNSLEDKARAADGVKAVYHISPNVHAGELESGRTAVAAAVKTGVPRFAFHSLCHPQIASLPHYWLKLRMEEYLKGSGLSFTILQPTPYMQHVLGQWQNIMERGVHEVPYQPSTRLGMAGLEDITKEAARVFTPPQATIG